MSASLELGESPYRRGQSPLFKTPGKSRVLTQLYLLNHTSAGNGLNQKNTYSPAKSCHDPGASVEQETPCKVSTPLGESQNLTEELSSTVSNPFEHFMLSRLHMPTFSPSVFSKMSTPSSDERSTKNFRWSIDQMAMLHPVDIDEKMAEQQVDIHDEELEGHAQKTIDTFFASQLIAPSPSPWSQGQVKMTSAASTNCSIIMESSCGNTSNGFVAQNSSCSIPTASKDVGCQTALSLPVGFDLQKILAEFYSSSDDAITDSLSTSTLRRKLFCQGDTESAPPSPDKMKGYPMNARSRDQSPQPCMSPGKFATPEQRRVLIKTAQFSSSPIVSMKSDRPLCRSHLSPGHDLLTSPELSPIISSRGKSVTKVSGNSVRSGDFSMPLTPSCFPLQATPSSGRQTLPFTSPDMSPINSDSPHSEKVGKTNHVQSLTFNDFSTQHESSSLHDGPLPHSPFLLSRQREITPERSSTPTEDSADSVTNSPSQHTNEHHNFHQAMFGGAAQLSVIRENQSVIDMEAGLTSSHQDTGYHTCSLQSMHQDTKSHCSSTTQDIHCAQNVTNQESVMATSVYDGANLHTDLTEQMIYMTAPGNDTGLGNSLNVKCVKGVFVETDKENVYHNSNVKINPGNIVYGGNLHHHHHHHQLSSELKTVSGTHAAPNVAMRHMDCSPTKVPYPSTNAGKMAVPCVGPADGFQWDPIGSSTPSRRCLYDIQNTDGGVDVHLGQGPLTSVQALTSGGNGQHEEMQH